MQLAIRNLCKVTAMYAYLDYGFQEVSITGILGSTSAPTMHRLCSLECIHNMVPAGSLQGHSIILIFTFCDTIILWYYFSINTAPSRTSHQIDLASK